MSESKIRSRMYREGVDCELMLMPVVQKVVLEGLGVHYGPDRVTLLTLTKDEECRAYVACPVCDDRPASHDALECCYGGGGGSFVVEKEDLRVLPFGDKYSGDFPGEYTK